MVQTRGSSAIELAQRRIALLMEIDENLDLGHGLTIGYYRSEVELRRQELENHNRLKAAFETSCQRMREMDKTITQLDDRMMSGVATKFGKTSREYTQVNIPRRKRSAAAPETPAPETEEIAALLKRDPQTSASN
jgi:hypothetical protein